MRVSTATYAAIAINALRMILRKTLRPRHGKPGETVGFTGVIFGLYGVSRPRYYFSIALFDIHEPPSTIESTCRALGMVLDRCHVSYTGVKSLKLPDFQQITGWKKRVPVSFSEVSSMYPGDVERALSNVLRNHLKDYEPVCF